MIRLFRSLPLLAAAALACGDSTTDIVEPDPPGPPARLQVIDGDEQRGFAGQMLPEPVVVQVLDSAGRPVPGQPVSFLVAAGGGSVSADTVRSTASGRAQVEWTLGPDPLGLQRIEVRVPIDPEETLFLFEIVEAVAEAAPTNLRFQAVYAGGLQSCGLTTTGGTYCWGVDPLDGDLDVVPEALGAQLAFSHLALGWVHTCGLTTAGAAHCWGANDDGQLGNGTRNSTHGPVPVSGGLVFQQIAAGYNHTCGLTGDGVAYCWGGNGYFGGDANGQLGDGTTTDRLVPTRVAGGIRFTALTLGMVFSCGLDEKGAAYCWGRVGNRTTTTLEPRAVGGGIAFASISAGSGHVCGLTADGAAYCWGDNFDEELGAGISRRWSAVPVPVAGGFRFSVIDAGYHHTCGLTLEGALACWGWSEDFDVLPPFDDGISIHSPTPVLVPGGHTFDSLSEGDFHGCGLTTDGEAYCWFENGNGMLGNGTQVSSYEPVKVK